MILFSIFVFKIQIMEKIIFLFFTFLGFVNSSLAQDKDSQAIINSIFDKMELQGVDTQKPLLYGYFFFDMDKSKLQILKDELLKDNYRIVRLEKTKKQNFILHVEKVEIHSRASLLERENQLDKLSKKFQIENYDGWDVGNPDPTKPIVSQYNFEKSLENMSKEELFTIANQFYNNEANDKAVFVFQKCIEQIYKLDTCFYKQGISYISLGQINLGIEKLELALKINPKYFKACFNIGVACYDKQEYQKSIEYYQKAAELDSNDDSVYYGIAASQFVLGKFNDAETNCIKALKINPNNQNSKSLLIKIKIKK